jgi:GNAT superfamily N-acetyltransferase
MGAMIAYQSERAGSRERCEWRVDHNERGARRDRSTALLTDREDLANALRQRGAALVRHLHAMRHDLATIRDDGRPQRLTLRPWQAGDTDALAAALVSAYGPEHPDARSGELASAAADLVHTAEDPDNPLIATATRVAVHDNEPVGAAIVVRSDHVRGFTGPWLMNVFRSSKPAARGAGSAMVVAALRSLRDANEERLGLAVTHTNVTARALYERLGFEYTMEGWVVITPTPT